MMNVETAIADITIPAVRKTYVTTVPADRLEQLAHAEAHRRLCLQVGEGERSVSVINSDGSMTVTMIVVSIDSAVIYDLAETVSSVGPGPDRPVVHETV